MTVLVAPEHPSPDELTLFLTYRDGSVRSISGWTDVHLVRGVEHMPSAFEIGLTEAYPGDTVLQIQPGPCQVFIGTDWVVTGYVERYNPSVSATSHTVRLSGRGKCCDLVDCAAEWPGCQISGASVLEIATKLAAPYGITVRAQTDVGGPIKQFNVMLGETAWEVIERICRYRALLAYEGPDGNLILDRAGTVSATGGPVQGQNVQAMSAEFSMDQRYSEYYVYLQSMDSSVDLGIMPPYFITKDDGVTRHRRKVIIAESGSVGMDIAKLRGLWEMNRRVGRGYQVHVTVDSWRDAAGDLWSPNTEVQVQLPVLKLPKTTWIISEVVFKRSNDSGTTADLTIMPARAFSVEPFNPYRVYLDIPEGHS
jgi:prophage tail gpP-like protein